MGGKRSLRGGFRPWLPDHRRPEGVVFRRYLRAAAELVGPATSERVRLAVERYAQAGVSYERATATWAAVVAKRETGRGKRPSAQAEERAARRRGLEDSTLQQALARLEELAARQRKPDQPADLIARWRTREGAAG